MAPLGRSAFWNPPSNGPELVVYEIPLEYRDVCVLLLQALDKLLSEESNRWKDGRSAESAAEATWGLSSLVDAQIKICNLAIRKFGVKRTTYKPDADSPQTSFTGPFDHLGGFKHHGKVYITDSTLSRLDRFPYATPNNDEWIIEAGEENAEPAKTSGRQKGMTRSNVTAVQECLLPAGMQSQRVTLPKSAKVQEESAAAGHQGSTTSSDALSQQGRTTGSGHVPAKDCNNGKRELSQSPSDGEDQGSARKRTK